jgi:hypothetical protein
MKHLLLAAAFAAGAIVPAMAQQFTPPSDQSATQQMQTVQTSGLQASGHLEKPVAARLLEMIR